MSSLSGIQVCLVEKRTLVSKKTVCAVSLNKATLFVLSLIALAFLSSGIYLLVGKIGTIPALTGGSGLLVGSVSIGVVSYVL